MKTAIRIFVISITLALAGGCIYLYIMYQKATEKPSPSPIEEAAKKQVETKAEIISQDVDKNGLEHTVAKMAKEIDNSALDKAKSDLLDTVEKLNITRDQLKQVMVVNTSLVITKEKLERKVSQLATTYSHFDEHFRLSVNVPTDTMEAATFDAGYDADLITTQYNKKRWLFLKDPFIDIYSNDPRFTIKGAKTLTIKPRLSGFGFSGAIVSDYNQIAGLSAGSGINIRFGKLSLKGGYQYYIDHKRWAADYGVRFRLIGQD